MKAKLSNTQMEEIIKLLEEDPFLNSSEIIRFEFRLLPLKIFYFLSSQGFKWRPMFDSFFLVKQTLKNINYSWQNDFDSILLNHQSHSLCLYQKSRSFLDQFFQS